MLRFYGKLARLAFKLLSITGLASGCGSSPSLCEGEHGTTHSALLASIGTSALYPRLDAQRIVRGLADLVDTRRGSHSFSGEPLLSRGNVFPATAMPFGFNFWTPLTNGESHSWLYDFQKDALTGFAVSHEPSTWMGDYGSMQLWPMTGAPITDPQARAARFSHANESARPYEYAVRMDNGIGVRIAPTDHAAIFDIEYPKNAPAFLMFDTINGTGGGFSIDLDERTLKGTIVTNTGFAKAQTMHLAVQIDGAELVDNERAVGRVLATTVRLAPTKNKSVTVRMATSWISQEQAQENLREVSGRSYDDVREAGRAVWDAALSRIQITGSGDEKRVFYANLYRTLLYPNNRAEMHKGGMRYRSPYNNAVIDGQMWVNNGFWDTYRSQWPLLTLMLPSATGAMLDGFARAYVEGGWTPRWSSPGYANLMTGTHADVVFADAYIKGVRNFDAKLAYASAVKNATVSAPDQTKGQGRNGLHRGMFLGYTPADVERESVAWHLEGCINDHGIAQMAKALGHSDDAAFFTERAKTYVNLFSPSVGFFRGRNADGSWRTADQDFNPRDWGHEFTEGDAWHYAFTAPFDADGLANLYGGRKGLVDKLDALFEADPHNVTTYYDSVIHEMQEATQCRMGQYGHSNEPLHHVIYLYNNAGQPWRTQERVRKVTDPQSGLYTVGSEDGSGWLGDEDNGQMSAWFVFSAMGFYPAVGAIPEYLIGSPLYTESTMFLENGNSFTVSAPNNNERNIYIQSATLNGEPLTRNFLRHEEVAQGGTLVLDMGPSPSRWGDATNELPYSLTRGAHAPSALQDNARGGRVLSQSEALDKASGADAAFDDDAHTSWVVRGNEGQVTYDFGEGKSQPLTWYTITSGPRSDTCDPQDWSLEGSNDGATWIALDQRRDESFTERMQTRMFRVDSENLFRMYRLTLRGNAEGCHLQVGEIEFVGPKRG